MIKSGDVKRSFAYSKGEGAKMVNLSFVLRIDVKDELVDFLELLEAAVEDVKEEIAKK